MKKPTTGGRWIRDKKTGAVALDESQTPMAQAARKAAEAAEAATADTNPEKEG